MTAQLDALDVTTTVVEQRIHGSRPGQRKSTTLTVVMIAALLYFMVPLVWLVINSTKTQVDLYATGGLEFGHTFALWDNLKRLFTIQDGIYGKWLLNTVFYAVVTAVGSALVSALAGYAMARFEFPGKRLFFAVVLGAVMIPGSVLAVPIFLLSSKVGLADTAAAVILPGLASPFGLYLMWVYAERSVPQEIIEAARSDGASEFRIFRSVVLRLMAPGITSVILFGLTGAWNNYFFPLILLTSPEKFPIAVGLAQLNGQANQTNQTVTVEGVYPLVLVGSLVAIVPLILAFLVLQRFWQSGLATGSVKM
ncbi:carbohydrate ABC transporter permease [Nakamurella deserti]|uniref:carbohydrate ABC transporter permease n=1 Tax=Nakamurella deserti TaxID=2164074 RepID=UPI00197BD279|nr:carbohydrate ABC transporter permease [Nakamurella deserti]